MVPVAILDPIYIDRTNFAVVPVLAYCEDLSEARPATTENDWVAPVPLTQLADPRTRFTVSFGDWKGPAFEVGDMVLWGFTAGVTAALLRVAGWEQEWDATAEHDLFRVLEQSANEEAIGSMRTQFDGKYLRGRSDS